MNFPNLPMGPFKMRPETLEDHLHAYIEEIPENDKLISEMETAKNAYDKQVEWTKGQPKILAAHLETLNQKLEEFIDASKRFKEHSAKVEEYIAIIKKYLELIPECELSYPYFEYKDSRNKPVWYNFILSKGHVAYQLMGDL